MDIASKSQEKAEIEGARLISGCKVRMHKLKMQNKSNCVSEGARQGAQ